MIEEQNAPKETKEEVDNSTFQMYWENFILGVILGIFGIIATFFARTAKRDRMYSVVAGAVVGAVINYFVFRYINS